MISRRALLGTGAGVVVVAAAAVYGDRAHKLDDLARTIGIEPRRLPALSDEALIKRVQTDQSIVLLSLRAVAQRQPQLAKTLAPLISITETQLADLGGAIGNLTGAAPPASAADALDDVIAMLQRSAAERSKESLAAVSGDFARVLASIAVSLSQSLVVLRNARKALT
ncbi:MAG: hypothetical protein H7288_20245 [Kineosporiaceae bacterium]|nr:hypothetical protein [Aeromicrobium sp.]